MWQLLNRNEYTTRGQNKVYCVFIYMHFSIFDKSLIKTKTKLERLLCWLMKTNADAVYFSTNWIFCLFYTIFENHSSQSLFFQHCERSELLLLSNYVHYYRIHGSFIFKSFLAKYIWNFEFLRQKSTFTSSWLWLDNRLSRILGTPSWSISNEAF